MSEQNQKSEQRAERKFVVLHRGISGKGGGGLEQGSVITESQVGSENVGRMLGLEAIREALPDEAYLRHVSVDLKSTTRDRSVEQRLAEAQRANADLAKELGDAKELIGILQYQLAAKESTAAAGAQTSGQSSGNQGGNQNKNK